MYIPKHFEEQNVEVLHGLIHCHPLATVVTLADSGMNANHIPLFLREAPAPFGTLIGHVARSNPILEDLKFENEILTIFHGVQNYVSPSWYPTKKETGKVVPTWNFAVVHAYGVLRIVDDPTWLRRQLEALTKQQEQKFTKPWAVDDAPEKYIQVLSSAIVGVEMVITKLIGKLKVSQNQPRKNQEGVIAGLREIGSDSIEEMCSLVQAHRNSAR